MPYPFIKLNPAGAASVPGTLVELPRDNYAGSYLAEPSDVRKGAFVADTGRTGIEGTSGERDLRFKFTGSYATKWTFDLNLLTIFPTSTREFIEIDDEKGLHIYHSDTGIHATFVKKNGSGNITYSAFVPCDVYSGNNILNYRVTFDNGIKIYINGKEGSKNIKGLDTGYDVWNGQPDTGLGYEDYINVSGKYLAFGGGAPERYATAVHAFRYYPGAAIAPDTPVYDPTSGAFIPQGQWNMSGVGSQGLQIQSDSVWNGSAWTQNISGIANLSFGYNNNNVGRFGFVYSGPNDTYLWPSHIIKGRDEIEGGLGQVPFTSLGFPDVTNSTITETGLGIPGSRQKDSGKIYFEIGRKGPKSNELITSWDLTGSTDQRKVFRIRSKTSIADEGYPTNSTAVTGQHGVLLDYDDGSMTIYNLNGTIHSTYAGIIQPYPMSLNMHSSDGYDVSFGVPHPVGTCAYMNMGQYPFYIHDHKVKSWEICSTAYRKNDFALFDGSNDVHSVVYNDTASSGFLNLEGLDKDVLFMNTNTSSEKSIIILKHLGNRSVFNLTDWGGLDLYGADVVKYEFDSLSVNLGIWGRNGTINVNGVNAKPETGVQIVSWDGNGSEGERYFDIETESPPIAAMILPHHGSQKPYFVAWSEEDGTHHSFDMRGVRNLITPQVDFFKVRSGLTAKVAVVTSADPNVPDINVTGVSYTAIVFSEVPGITDVTYKKKRPPVKKIRPISGEEISPVATVPITTIPSFGLIKHFSSSPLSGHDYLFWMPECPFYAKRTSVEISEYTKGGVSAWSTIDGPLDLNESTGELFSFNRIVQPVVIRQGLLEDHSDYRGNVSTNGYDENDAYVFSLVFGKSSMYSCRQSSAPLLPLTEIKATDSNFITALVKWSNGEFSDALIQGMDTSEVTDMTELRQRVIDAGGNSTNMTSFNLDIGGWNTGKVTTMRSMFANMTAFNKDINGWNTSKVKYMQSMFNNCDFFNKSLNSWNTASVLNMAGMFEGAHAFNGNISSWNTANVTDMRYMFFTAHAFNQNISGWNTAKVTDMEGMFYSATVFNRDISGWDVSKVSKMDRMFRSASAFKQDLFFWCTSSMSGAPFEFNRFASSYFTGIKIPDWGTCQSPIVVNNSSFITRLVQWSNNLLSDGALAHMNTAAVSDMFYLYDKINKNGGNASKFLTFNVDIGGWNTGNVTSMRYMFYRSTTFNQNLTNWDVRKVTDMASMFRGVTAFNGDLSGWQTLKNRSLNSTFNGCTNFNKPLNHFDTREVTDFSQTFEDAVNFNQSLNNWRMPTTGGLLMKSMFRGATRFNGAISNWNVDRVVWMGYMFDGCSYFNQNISGWNVGSVTDIGRMFQNAVRFNQNLSGWSFPGASTVTTNFALGASAWPSSRHIRIT